ncbi:uncharacterized protein METZ01_LOCUS286387 [marine metagenome]|uniref:Uncharacterized protein n=1 Tax=marine metagenome TaxID=408172 RepID=A0A382LBU8_9ZZZZ
MSYNNLLKFVLLTGIQPVIQMQLEMISNPMKKLKPIFGAL